ncbi:hypothetical protein PspLS_02295 [Pyricularia sp. CBS 133598]|nr:hypothetical protein PspLS_02295 [Pyricularia sp. CBS 133598]
MNRTSVESIQTADSLARALYRRARLSGPDFSDIATVVRSLHTCLKHLRVEAEDPDSLLNTTQQEHSVYARQLGPIVEDCDFTLKQLDTILEKYGGSSADTPSEEGPHRDGYIVGTADSREKDMIALIRTKLANQKTNIDIFLDTVQLHNPAKARQQFVDNPQSQQLDSIKDKVDAIAARLARRRVAHISAGDMEEEELWQQFSTELEREGFSSEVLMRNKEVLRAYIREMDSNGLLDQAQPPSVRGLLPAAEGPTSRGPPMSITPYPSDNRDAMSPKEVISPPMTANEKFLPSVKLNRGPPDYDSVHSSQNEYSPENAHGGFSNQMSPRSRAYSQSQQPQPQSAPPHQTTHAPPYPHDPLQSPALYGNHGHQRVDSQQYQAPILYNPPLPAKIPHRQNSGSDSGNSDSDSTYSDSNNSLALISTRDLMQLDHRMTAMHLGPPQPSPLFFSPGTSPNGPGGRYLPAPPVGDQLPPGVPGSPSSLPPYSSPTSSVALAAKPPPPPAYGSSPMQMPGIDQHQQQQRQFSRLQPDSHGNEIPLEATWTKIRRTLVSPEVLDRAGVRYEARPDFVAILGVLSREQIAQFARESDEVRRARYGGQNYAPPRFNRGGSSGIRDNGMRYNYRDEKWRSGSTSESDDVLWDSDSSSDEGSRERERRPYGGRPYRETPEKERRRGSDETEKNANDEKTDDKGTKVYPFVLPMAAVAAAKGLDGKATPASTVPPKPILKNKNENHVRFDREGPIEISPEDMSADKRRREQQRRERDREPSRERDRDRDRDRDRERDRERRRRDRDRERERDGDRRDYYYGSRHGHHRHSSSMDGRRHGHHSQGAEPSRDRESARRDKKKAWGQTLGAAGIGGAAASLLSVLTEAATGF